MNNDKYYSESNEKKCVKHCSGMFSLKFCFIQHKIVRKIRLCNQNTTKWENLLDSARMYIIITLYMEINVVDYIDLWVFYF